MNYIIWYENGKQGFSQVAGITVKPYENWGSVAMVVIQEMGIAHRSTRTLPTGENPQ